MDEAACNGGSGSKEEFEGGDIACQQWWTAVGRMWKEGRPRSPRQCHL